MFGNENVHLHRKNLSKGLYAHLCADPGGSTKNLKTVHLIDCLSTHLQGSHFHEISIVYPLSSGR